jgi:hypothetical protein
MQFPILTHAAFWSQGQRAKPPSNEPRRKVLILHYHAVTVFGGPYDSNNYLGISFNSTKIPNQDMEVAPGDCGWRYNGSRYLADDASRNGANLREGDCARDLDFAVVNVKKGRLHHHRPSAKSD